MQSMTYTEHIYTNREQREQGTHLNAQNLWTLLPPKQNKADSPTIFNIHRALQAFHYAHSLTLSHSDTADMDI